MKSTMLFTPGAYVLGYLINFTIIYALLCLFCRMILQNRRFRGHFGQFEGQIRIPHENLHHIYIIRLDPAIYVGYCADFVLLSQCRSATARIRRRNRNIPAPRVILEVRFELSNIKYPLAYFFGVIWAF